MTRYQAEAAAIGQTVASWRRDRGDTLGTLGARAAISRATLSRIERGLTTPNVFEAARLAGALGLTVDELVAGIGADRVYGQGGGHGR